uniref:HMA domain-containing protein n=1 Tax=Cannabis sativa TaxID=3483 RepID=A0A803PSR3_CANSA
MKPAVTTAVLKLRLHCQGCISKIHKTVTRTKGFNDMSIDKQKELVTVIGSMDMKALAESLQDKLKRPVEIVPPKKEKDAGEKGSGKGDNAGGGKKKGGGGGGDGGQNVEAEGGMVMMDEISRINQYMGQPAFGYGYGHGHGYPPAYIGENVHAPQMFSDENPNACSVM